MRRTPQPTPVNTEHDKEPVDTFASRILSLEVGQTEAKAVRFDGNEATKEAIKDTIESLRNSVAAAVSRASKKTGYQFVTEGGDIRTKSFDFLIMIGVTRIS